VKNWFQAFAAFKFNLYRYNVLQSFDKMMLVNPMVSYQEKLDISMDSQRTLQASFKSSCVHDPIIDSATGALTAPRQLNVGPGQP
jgi:hypothetical protein